MAFLHYWNSLPSQKKLEIFDGWGQNYLPSPDNESSWRNSIMGIQNLIICQIHKMLQRFDGDVRFENFNPEEVTFVYGHKVPLSLADDFKKKYIENSQKQKI